MTYAFARFQQWFAPILLSVLALGGLLAIAAPAVVPSAHAQDLITDEELLPSEFSDNVGLGQTDLRTTIARIIRAVLGFLGVIAFAMLLYGGFMWMTAGGNNERVETAQKIIVAAAIGLAIILSAYAITSFVVNQLVTATTSSE